jgi:hypothetical protein
MDTLLNTFVVLLGILLFVKAIVTEEDGMESIAHRFLSAAVKVCFFPLFFFLILQKINHITRILCQYHLVSYGSNMSFLAVVILNGLTRPLPPKLKTPDHIKRPMQHS